jgi:SAM-dependent methyltransferase
MRPLFPGRPYVGCDFRLGPGVDRVEDLRALTLEDETVGTAFVLETFEHVDEVTAAAAELYRVIRPGGVLIASAPMTHPIHNHPGDYWRFTPQGLAQLLKAFDIVHTFQAGWDPLLPHTVFALTWKGAAPSAAQLHQFQQRHEASQAALEKSDRIKIQIGGKAVSTGHAWRALAAYTARRALRRLIAR